MLGLWGAFNPELYNSSCSEIHKSVVESDEVDWGLLRATRRMSREAESAELGVHLRHVEMVEEQEVKPSQASKAVESVSLPKINH